MQYTSDETQLFEYIKKDILSVPYDEDVALFVDMAEQIDSSSILCALTMRKVTATTHVQQTLINTYLYKYVTSYPNSKMLSLFLFQQLLHHDFYVLYYPCKNYQMPSLMIMLNKQEYQRTVDILRDELACGYINEDTVRWK